MAETAETEETKQSGQTDRNPVEILLSGGYQDMGPLDRAEVKVDLFKDFVINDPAMTERYESLDEEGRDEMAQEYFEGVEKRFPDFFQIEVEPEKVIKREVPTGPSLAAHGPGMIGATATAHQGGPRTRMKETTIPARRSRVRDLRTERLYDLLKSGDLHIGDFESDDVAALVGTMARERDDEDVLNQVRSYAQTRTQKAGVTQNDLRRIAGVRGTLGDISQGLNRLMTKMQEKETEAQREMIQRGAGGSERTAELKAGLEQQEQVEEFAKVVNHPIVDFVYPGTGQNWETIGALSANVGLATSFYRQMANRGINLVSRGGIARGGTMETGLSALQAKELPGMTAEAAGVDPGSVAGRLLTGAEMAALATAVNFAPSVIRSIRGKPADQVLQNDKIRRALEDYGVDVEAEIARRSEGTPRGQDEAAGRAADDAQTPSPETEAARVADEVQPVKPDADTPPAPAPSAHAAGEPRPPATPKDWEGVVPKSAREAIDKAEATGKPLAQSEIDKLPKVERDVLNDLPNLATDEGLRAMRGRTRGVVHDEEAVEASRRLGWTEADVLELPEGRALNAEQKLAVSGVVKNAIERTNAMKPKVARARLAPDSTENMDIIREYVQMKSRMMRLIQVERGVASEAGRALRAHRLTMDSISQEEQALSEFLANRRVPQDAKDFAVAKLADFEGDPEAFLKMLRSLNQATKWEKIVEMATAFKLSAIPTQVVNISSSIARQVTQIPIRAVAGSLDATVGRAWRGNRTRWIGDALDEAYGQLQGYRGMSRDLKHLLRDEEYALQMRQAQDFYKGRGPAIKGRPWENKLRDQIQDWMGTIIRLPFRGLSLGDILVRRPSEHGALYTAAARDARRNGLEMGTKAFDEHVANRVTNPDPEWLEWAKHEGTTNLFQRETFGIFQEGEKLRRKYPITKLIVPFYRTLNDLVRQGIEFSPATVVRPDFWRAVGNRGETMDNLAKAVIGTSTLVPLSRWAAEGNITGAAPKTAAERDQFYREGKQPYSVRVGNKWYPYYRLAPFSYWFVTAEKIGTAAERDDDETISEMVADGAFTMSRAIMDQSFVVGISDTLDAMTDETAFDRWWRNTLVGATMPNFFAQAARSIDPTIRDVKQHEGWRKTWDYYKARIPFVSQNLPARMNAFGQELERPGSGWLRFFSPIVPSKAQMDTVTAEMAAIDYQLGPPGRQAYGFEIENEQYRDFHRVSGNVIHDVLSGIVIMPEWQSAKPSDKERVFDGVVSRVRSGVREAMLLELRMKNEIADQISVREGITREEARRKAEKAFEEPHWQEIYQSIVREPDLSGRTEEEGD